MYRPNSQKKPATTALAVALLLVTGATLGGTYNISNSPLFITSNVPPLTMLVLARDHKLYYEAYNDASDLNGDGTIDTRYTPVDIAAVGNTPAIKGIDYFGYFDSYKCYTYDAGDGRFNPASVTPNKQCSGQWSGDFLNYVTTSRIDALRKVFYGGYRSTDTATETVLQRTFIPQDAHSWGKEYTSIAVDGYDISNYTPLSLPATNTHHLFANTTLISANDPPLMRVLTNSPFRVWEWLSIERPVAGSQCATGNNVRVNCTTAGAGGWQIVPSSAFSGLTQTTYNISGASIPNNHAEYDTLVANYAVIGNRFGTGPANQINGSGNPYGSNDDYLTLFHGQLAVPSAGTYTFAVDGDDAVEVLIDGSVVASWYGGHGSCNCQTYSGSVSLAAGNHTIVFRHMERDGGDNYYLWWQVGGTPALTDYQVRTKVCATGLLEENCQIYPSLDYKPVGLLQEYGENAAMKFGLMSGSYRHNTVGGVLRKAVGSITDEIDPDTGQFTATNGIIKTIDKLRVADFNYADYAYSCGWITTRPITDGECSMWGNPVAEMMYEGMRYFAGKAAPTTAFSISDSDTPDSTLSLPVATWTDPYAANSGNERCAKPFEIVISDINPSYDTDQVPGSYFASVSGDITGLAVQTEADTITAHETGFPGLYFIGQSGTTYDGAPSAKTVTGLGDIRGLSPEEPTKQGGYYAASVGYFGHTHDLNPATDDQLMDIFSVALASPLPRIEIPVGDQHVTLVPYGKSVGGSGISATQGNFQPTNQIVDFYASSITPTTGSFRINFEDVEQGADHDMDAVVLYEYRVNPDNTVTINLSSDYAAGGIIQHMGYVISGTTADGTYLEVRDSDTGSGSDPDYFLDTPPSWPVTTWSDGAPLPLTASRTFTPSGIAGATLLKDPLWYAAKWGGFIDKPDASGITDHLPNGAEWDANNDGQPDNYYLVTNALALKDQLANAFDEVLERTGSASTVALTSGSITSSSKVFQARFKSKTWTGQLLAFPINSDGSIGSQLWDSGDVISAQSATSRSIVTYKPSSGSGIPFRWPANTASPTSNELDPVQISALNVNPDSGTSDSLGSNRVRFIRGDDVSDFRSRIGKLGDIIDSAPVFVSAPRARYPNDWDDLTTTGNDTLDEDSVPYPTWRQATARSRRQQVVYFGANDGMLHGVDAGTYDNSINGFTNGTGGEILGYVPSPLFANLAKLTSPNYTHRYYVDASATYGDTFFAGDWHTVLGGGMGAGGQGIFALDITDPSSFGEASADAISLWEFTDAYAGDTDSDGIADGTDLGYTLNQPVNLVRMHNGKWAAVFGNGYNNTETDSHASITGNAVLFIVDVETGDLIHKIDTHVGMSGDPLAAGRPNGMSAPAPVDVDGDYIVDYIYAGDLFGNLWKFDVTSANAGVWASVYGSVASPQPLFVALAPDDTTRQPITTRPQVGLHPTVANTYMVYFGTGKYFEVADNQTVGQTTQSFYGVWDENDATLAAPITRTNLLEQEIVAEVSQGFDTNSDGTNDTTYDLRVISDNAICWTSSLSCPNPKKGWYLDLITPAGDNQGERQVSDAILQNDRIIFTTLIPSSDPCSGGGTGWLMELDASNGGRFSFAPFDLNGNGTFDNSDNVVWNSGSVPPGGKKSKVGIIPTPAILFSPSATGGVEFKYTSGTQGGEIEITTENPGPGAVGRQTWRQIF
jgi:type IV pilus assembly protein PilY1